MRKRAVRKVVVATCAMLTFASFASAQSITLSGDYDPIYDGSLPWNVGGNIQNGFQFGDFLLGFEANGQMVIDGRDGEAIVNSGVSKTSGTHNGTTFESSVVVDGSQAQL